jgi:hypothetical protein
LIRDILTAAAWQSAALKYLLQVPIPFDDPSILGLKRGLRELCLEQDGAELHIDLRPLHESRSKREARLKSKLRQVSDPGS